MGSVPLPTPPVRRLNDARAKTGAIATAHNWLWNFLIGFFTPFITGDIQYSYSYVFAGCNLANAIIVYFFLYESSRLSAIKPLQALPRTGGC
ncbi:hypothetical protein JCM10207_008971 [Rhodosporidiobolus poonsookiae]